MSEILRQAERARAAWRALSIADGGVKTRALEYMVSKMIARKDELLEANADDVRAARENGRAESFIERLTLNDKRVCAMADGLSALIDIADPVGEIIEDRHMPSGLHILKRRVPIGVVAIIYESRPNVTADAAALCLKSGNVSILRGGSDALRSNLVITKALREGIVAAGLPEDCVSLVEDVSRETAQKLMTMNELVDLLIPRGGRSLIESVVRSATVPVIQTGDGICHVYIDGECDMDMAVDIAVSAKVSRPSVCNSAETLLVDRTVADAFLPVCLDALREKGVEVRGDETVLCHRDWVVKASDADYHTEYNALIYNVKVVSGVEAAIAHINAHGTRHSEAIVTANTEHGRRFQAGVDAAAVYINASTRFTDGGEFGLGAEVGISNQKLHARGPMGLKELTTYKYEVTGTGQTR